MEKVVEKVEVDYFEELFTTSSSDFDGFLEEITPTVVGKKKIKKITPTITHQMNQRLIRIATEDEV